MDHTPGPRRPHLLPALLVALINGSVGFAAGQTPPGAVAAPPAAADPAAYRLTPGDTLEVRHAFNPELNEAVQIRPDGRVSLPLIGEVQVAMKTVQEVVAELEHRYASEIRAPRIMLQIRGYAAQKVWVTGEVLRPGLVNMPGPMTLFEAISESGGIKTTGSTTSVLLIRKGPDGKAQGRKVKPFVDGQIAADAAIPLQPFDVVIVPETRIARVDRWVDQYIRQMIPISVGFTYLFQHQPGAIPIF